MWSNVSTWRRADSRSGQSLAIHLAGVSSIKDKNHTFCCFYSQHLPICQEQWQHVNIDGCHLVEIMKHQRVSEDVRRPSQWSIRNTKHHHKQAGMRRCQPRPQSQRQAHYQLIDNTQHTQHSSILWLRSASDRTCVVPRTHNSFGDRSFSAAGPRVWNALPPELRHDISFGL